VNLLEQSRLTRRCSLLPLSLVVSGRVGQSECGLFWTPWGNWQAAVVAGVYGEALHSRYRLRIRAIVLGARCESRLRGVACRNQSNIYHHYACFVGDVHMGNLSIQETTVPFYAAAVTRLPPNKALQTDKVKLSCLLHSEKPGQLAFAPELGRYTSL
jgi:hypothetical protein